ncbi:hypothetical protein [Xenorhabdus littoralis]|uniref:hypothetical protein n=1 Tax=Xenorhabdus littoralis TaxID=2582835 RepID=UPI0029E7DBC5|nr:hypothetical protein [Xenorhabdus sp. psl]MDX7990118.1 hypothetical protein [Xenorhabdus sp. psl]
MSNDNGLFDPPKWGNQSANFRFNDNSLIYSQTPDLASGYTVAAPIILVKLSNPLIFNQTAYLQSAYNLSAEDIGMQHPMLHNRTFGVTDSYSQTLRNSLRGVQTLRSSLSGVQKEKDSTANATLWRNPNLVYVINQLVNRKANVLYDELQSVKRLPDNFGVANKHTDCNSPFEGIGEIPIPNIFPSAATITISVTVDLNHVNNVHLVSYCSVDDLVLRWRRLISVLAATTRNPAVLSSFSLTCSINSKSSSGSLTETCRDLLLRLPVAITESPSIRWCSVCTKNYLFQVLTWCSPVDILVVFTLIKLRQKQQRPEVLGTLSRRLTKPLTKVTIMAIQQHTQTHLKFTFLMASGNQRLVDIHPVRLISVQGVSHV